VNYLIFGKPRSRTAWTANFMTYADSFCVHEGLADCSIKAAALKPYLDALPGRVNGNSDTGMIHLVDDLLEVFPDARLAVLTENQLSWQGFISRSRIHSELVRQIERDYAHTKELVKKKGGLLMPVDALTTDPEAARFFWHHCTGAEKGFSYARFKIISDLNIQVQEGALGRRMGLPAEIEEDFYV
jgi:hypothetical protein